MTVGPGSRRRGRDRQELNMAKATNSSLGRRGFLKGAAAGAAVGASAVVTPEVQAQDPQQRGAAPPSAAHLEAERNPAARGPQGEFIERPGADYMVDVIKSLGVEYFISNPGSSFRGLHE